MKKLVFAFLLMTASFSGSAMGYPQSVFTHQRALTQQIELKKLNIPTKLEPLKLTDASFREKLVNSAIFVAEKIYKWFM
jgi:hypothetical protein